MGFDFQQYKEILSFIDKNCRNSINKPKIVAISKNHPISSVKKALSSGIKIFGENRVQEALAKFRGTQAGFGFGEGMHIIRMVS